MSEIETTNYRLATDEEQQALGISERYDVLVGPKGFVCYLGEPEDCRWTRDGKKAVAELNRLLSTIKTLEDRRVKAGGPAFPPVYTSEPVRQAIQDAMQACPGLPANEFTADAFGRAYTKRLPKDSMSIPDILWLLNHCELVVRASEPQGPGTVYRLQSDPPIEGLYHIEYICPSCQHFWQDKWSCAVDGTCPKCGVKNISPSTFKPL